MDLANLPFPHPRQLPTADNIQQSKLIIEHLDRNIEYLEHNIRQFQAQLREVRQKRANYVSYVSPLRRLPTGILRKIVYICLEDGEEITVMAGICSRLREVVIGMTRIWSHITLRTALSPENCIVPFYIQYGYSGNVRFCFDWWNPINLLIEWYSMPDGATASIGSDKSRIGFIEPRNILAGTHWNLGNHLVSEMPYSLT
jgi:hypothetical protein